jgi:DNA polymerase-3 subunit epsilon
MSSGRLLSIQAAKEVLQSDKYVLLDTETTGTKNDHEVLEVAVIQASTGKILLDTLVKPSKPFDAVEGVHTVVWEDLQQSPDITQCGLSEILTAYTVLTYNAQFDYRLIRQSYEFMGQTMPGGNFACVMLMYAAFRSGPGKASTWIKLQDAIKHEGIDFVQEHRALSDIVMTRRILECMANVEPF